MKHEASHLAWFSAYDSSDEKELKKTLEDEAKVILNRSLDFGEEEPFTLQRITMPTSVLEKKLPTNHCHSLQIIKN